MTGPGGVDAALLRQIVAQNTQAAIYVKRGPELRYELINERFRRILGVTDEVVLNKPFTAERPVERARAALAR